MEYALHRPTGPRSYIVGTSNHGTAFGRLQPRNKDKAFTKAQIADLKAGLLVVLCVIAIVWTK